MSSSRVEYYSGLKKLAHDVRGAHAISGCRVMRSDMRRIYKALGIRIDIWPHKLKGLRGAYFNDSIGPTVLLAKLPTDPLVFTMAHELKHHLADQAVPITPCGAKNQNESIEIGAEVFAAEFLFPESEFIRIMTETGVTLGQCTPTSIIDLKRTTQTTLSYQGLVKRAEFLGFALPGALPKTGWKKMEEARYGVPFYKQKRRSTN